MRSKLLVALCCLLLVPIPNAQRRVVVVRPLYVYHYDPFWDPWYYGPGYIPAYNYGPEQGQVKFQDFDKHDEVYINGAFAGSMDKVKNLHLNPGSYDLVVKSHHEQILERRVYVLPGKTLKIKAG